MILANTKKRCTYCKEYFLAEKMVSVPAGYFCTIEHAKEYGLKRSQALKVKRERAEHKKARENIKRRSDWIKEAQSAFNAYIRIRDKYKPCISCGRHHQGQYHAGHFYTTKARPDIRFNVFNVHKQCSVCNNYLSGNLLPYRENLILKIGLDRVEDLRMERIYLADIEHLKRVKDIFSRKTKLYKKRFRL